MNKCLKALFTVSSISMLCACQSMKLKEGENKIRLGQYKVILYSPVSYLMISLSDQDFARYKEYQKNDQLCNKNSVFTTASGPVAHDEFENGNPLDYTKWYWGSGTSEVDGTMLEGTKKYAETEEELNMRITCVDFYLSIEGEDLNKNVSISLSDITYPECNAASAIVIGDDGYQEMNSLGEGLTDGVLIKSLVPQEPRKITVVLYVDGNDPFVTNEHIDYINKHCGKISFTLSVTENDSYNTSDEINSL